MFKMNYLVNISEILLIYNKILCEFNANVLDYLIEARCSGKYQLNVMG
jgi:hypothetical protein